MRRIGMSLWAVNGLSIEEYAALLKEYGFETTFEIATDVRATAQNAEVLARYGIEFDSLHAPWKNINAIWRDNEYTEAAYAQLANAVDISAEVGCPNTVVHLSSGLTPPPPTDAGRALFIRLVEHAEKKKVTVAFENQRMLGNIGWAFEEFKDSPYVGFCYDCGHEGCFTPGRQYMPLFGSRLVYTHIHDNTCEFNKDQHRLPFDGNIDYARVTRQIRESGFGGSLTLEVNGKSEFYASLSPREFFARASAAAHKLRDMTDKEA